ncbi:hypothetical protein NCCP2145_23510 [Pseudarthrobacter sp. NCCP-2145]|nr:hypothetical protein NCCP2145_23510 [Pseudarthrobacter sp. NCCP-2145]
MTTAPDWSMKRSFKSPSYITEWDQLLVVKLSELLGVTVVEKGFFSQGYAFRTEAGDGEPDSGDVARGR